MYDVKMKWKDTWTWKRAAKYILLKENVTYYLFSSQEVLKQFSFYMKCVNVENKVHMYWHTSQFLYIPPCIYIYIYTEMAHLFDVTSFLRWLYDTTIFVIPWISIHLTFDICFWIIIFTYDVAIYNPKSVTGGKWHIARVAVETFQVINVSLCSHNHFIGGNTLSKYGTCTTGTE